MLGGAETFLMKIYRNIDKGKYQFDFSVSVKEKEFYNEYKVNGVLYCHSNRKLCITSSVESAIKVVELT